MKKLLTLSFMLIVAISANAQFGKLKKQAKGISSSSAIEKAKEKASSEQKKLEAAATKEVTAKAQGELNKASGKVMSKKGKIVGDIKKNKKKVKNLVPKM